MRTYIIAEIGLSHRGDLVAAVEAVRTFAACGADAIKVQDHRWQQGIPEDQDHPSPHVQMKRAEWYRKTAFGAESWARIRQECKAAGVDYIVSPFSVEALEEQLKLEPRYIKIASGEVTNLKLLEAAAKSGVPMLVSGGMATREEHDETFAAVMKAGVELMLWLVCTSEYPCPPEHSKLSWIKDGSVGVSDHTQDIWFPIAAVARGATLIEKHACLEKSGHSDVEVSLLPAEFRAMVDAIRKVERALYASEEPDVSEARRVFLHA